MGRWAGTPTRLPSQQCETASDPGSHLQFAASCTPAASLQLAPAAIPGHCTLSILRQSPSTAPEWLAWPSMLCTREKGRDCGGLVLQKPFEHLLEPRSGHRSSFPSLLRPRLPLLPEQELLQLLYCSPSIAKPSSNHQIQKHVSRYSITHHPTHEHPAPLHPISRPPPPAPPKLAPITRPPHHGQADQEPLGAAHRPHRSKLPNRRRARRYLLAQDLLGLCDDDPQRRRQARPHPANHQPALRHPRAGVGMAVALAVGHWHASQYGDAAGRLSAEQSGGAVAVSGDESGALLYYRDGRLLLGIQ
ncbi:MAG: hypothetical protein FRX48_00868 [Lasallia pustulata]|uniref:Uncharacterized protein n=1 Tax=Lasallia pustulata TaxID=136370 RepID=A0A5M8Q4Y6_9LECA|nr:MAG: hypothetical protein FRX48_00868 [Lasallia pustulata]